MPTQTAAVDYTRVAQLLAAVKTHVAKAADIIDGKASVLEDRFKHARGEFNPSPFIRLIHWAFVETVAALEPLMVICTSRADKDAHILAAGCHEQRQHLLWCRASLKAVCKLLGASTYASRNLQDETLALAALIPELDQPIGALHPSTLKLLPSTD
jgi:hypothetical protein